MIVNASPVIIFAKLNKLDLLKRVIGEITVSEEVYKEVVDNGINLNSPEAFLVKDFVEKGKINVGRLNQDGKEKANFLANVYSQIDKGEAETVALALQEKEETILIDEKIARKVAKLHKLKPIGSLRVLLLAFDKKMLNKSEIREIISEMTSMNFRLSGRIIAKFWELFEKLNNK